MAQRIDQIPIEDSQRIFNTRGLYVVCYSEEFKKEIRVRVSDDLVDLIFQNAGNRIKDIPVFNRIIEQGSSVDSRLSIQDIARAIFINGDLALIRGEPILLDRRL